MLTFGQVTVGIHEVGGLSLGVVVGFIIFFTVFRDGAPTLTLKIAKGAISSVLTGAPVLLYRGEVKGKWFYPLGLLIALLIVRLITLRKELVELIKGGFRSMTSRRMLMLVGTEMALILVIIGISFIWAALL